MTVNFAFHTVTPINKASIKAKKIEKETFPTFHKPRLNLRKNGYGLHFLNQVDFSILESLDLFEHDDDGCFSLRDVQDYLGLDPSTLRNSLNKLCNYALLFATVNMSGKKRHRIRYGYYDARVSEGLDYLKVIRNNQYFGLKGCEQNVIMLIKTMADSCQHVFFDMGEVTSGIAPDLFARSPYIYKHAREDKRFIVCQPTVYANALGFSVTRKGFDVYSAWNDFTDLVDEFQQKM